MLTEHLFAGAVPESDGGRGHRRRPGRESGSCDHRPRGQRDGDHALEPDAGHSEETRVHVAPSAQDLGLLTPLHTLDLYQVTHFFSFLRTLTFARCHADRASAC